MSQSAPVHAKISGPIVMIGFGSIGKGTLPLIERHFDYDKSRFVIIDPHDNGEIAKKHGVRFIQEGVTRDNYRELLVLAFVFVMTVLVFTREWQLMSELQQGADVLHAASVTDPLTGLRNRRYFSRQIDVDARRALSIYAHRGYTSHGDVILYIVYLDHFKSVNDNFGHDVGDKLLLEVSRRITSVIRETDFLVRWGGDEFLVVSRYTNREEASVLADRVLQAVGGEPLPLKGGQRLRCSCSVGWAVFPWFIREQTRPSGPSQSLIKALAAGRAPVRQSRWRRVMMRALSRPANH